MASKHLAGTGITGPRAEAGVDHGVLDVFVPQPIPAKGRVLASIQYVRGDGVLEGVKFPLVSRYARRISVFPHQRIQGTSINGELSVGEEQVRGIVSTFPEIRPDQLYRVGLHRVDPRERALEAMDGNSPLLEVNIGALEQPDLGSPQSVTVGHGKDRAVPFVFDHREKAAHFFLGQEGDGGILPSPSWWGCFSIDYHSRELSPLYLGQANGGFVA